MLPSAVHAGLEREIRGSDAYEVVWHGGRAPTEGFTKGELLPQYESRTAREVNPAVVVIETEEDWRNLIDVDPFLRFLGRFGPWTLKLGREKYGRANYYQSRRFRSV